MHLLVVYQLSKILRKYAAETGSPLDPELLLKKLVPVTLDDLLGKVGHIIMVNTIPEQIVIKKALQSHFISKATSKRRSMIAVFNAKRSPGGARGPVRI